ncbi:uncharacterized, partial [Tachysurus ichikawai]
MTPTLQPFLKVVKQSLVIKRSVMHRDGRFTSGLSLRHDGVMEEKEER